MINLWWFQGIKILQYELTTAVGVSFWKLQVLSIGIGNGIFNTFEMLKSIEVLDIQYNFVRVMVLSIQYFEMSIGSYPDCMYKNILS